MRAASITQKGYDALWLALAVLWLRRHLRKRISKGKELPARIGERFGVTTALRPPGKLVWLHGASVGESIALLPFVEKLRALHPAPTVLVTTGSVTSAAVMEQRLPHGAIHQFVPLDRKLWVERFMDHWRPDAVIWAESEIWPRLLASIHDRNIPAALLNARLSDKTLRGWSRFRRWLQPLLAQFSPVTAVTNADAARWQQLAGTVPALIANMKFAVPAAGCDAEDLALLHGAIGNRPVWLAAVIHPGEETIAADVHRHVRKTFPDLLTIIAPRHPHRGTEFAATLRAQGLNVSLRSTDEAIGPQTDAYIADRIGEMGLLYRLAKIVFVGGSLILHGGQNPIEGAKLGAALLRGPRMFNFTDITAAFAQAGAMREIRDSKELGDAVLQLLQHPHEAADMGRAALAVCAAEERNLDLIWTLLAPWRAKAGLPQ